MVLIFVRHSDDESVDCSQIHDCQLVKNGWRLARNVGKKLIDKYGIPDIIYVSPFRRTIQTMEGMLNGRSTEIIEDKRLCRYFNGSSKYSPKVDPKTMKKNIPIKESFDEFEKRVKNFSRFISTSSPDKVIWIITHVLVYKRLIKTSRGHIPFMDYRVIEYCTDCSKYH